MVAATLMLLLAISCGGESKESVETTGPLISLTEVEVCVGGAAAGESENGACFPLTDDSDVGSVSEGDLVTVRSEPGDPGTVISVKAVPPPS